MCGNSERRYRPRWSEGELKQVNNELLLEHELYELGRSSSLAKVLR